MLTGAGYKLDKGGAVRETERSLTTVIHGKEFDRDTSILRVTASFNEDEFLKTSIRLYQDFIVKLIEDDGSKVNVVNEATRTLASEIMLDLKNTIAYPLDEKGNSRSLEIKGNMWVAMATAMVNIINISGIHPSASFKNAVLGSGILEPLNDKNPFAQQINSIVLSVAKTLEDGTIVADNTSPGMAGLTHHGEIPAWNAAPGTIKKNAGPPPYYEPYADPLTLRDQIENPKAEERVKSIMASLPIEDQDNETYRQVVQHIITTIDDYAAGNESVPSMVAENLKEIPGGVNREEGDIKRFLRVVGDTLARVMIYSVCKNRNELATEYFCNRVLMDLVICDKKQLNARKKIWYWAIKSAHAFMRTNKIPLDIKLADDINFDAVFSRLRNFKTKPDVDATTISVTLFQIAALVSHTQESDEI